ncbi:MAG TPA: hypothetical protein VE090_01900 [Methylomirabilota bacterium]|nr:hypothetical protein [Methylomirabilota bacterium]
MSKEIFDGQIKKGAEIRQQQRPRITPEAFIADGNSTAAHAFAREWNEAKQDGVLTAIVGCSDARIIYNPKHAVGIRTIAAAIPDELYENVLDINFGTKNVVIMVHHDGRRVEPGVRPPGCGGLDEKAKMRDVTHDTPPEGALRYVHEQVAHEDPIIDAWYSSLQIAEQSHLSVLAVTQDHISGKLSTIGTVQPTEDGGIKYHSEISLRQILHGQYDPKEIYANGIPQLPREKIPKEFNPFLIRHQRHLDELKSKNPDFELTQTIQNPDTVLITTVVRPSRGRLPTLSGESSNRVFAITVARQAGEVIDVDEQSILNAADELQYPLANSIISQGNPSKPFSSLFKNGTVIFETRNMARSRHVAEDLLSKDWFRTWADVKGNKIIVAQTTRGIVDSADYFPNKTK